MKRPLQEQLALYFVMGSVNCQDDPLYVLEEALRGGVTLFQLREKGAGALQGDAAEDFARECQRLCQQYEVPFIVNDDVELALRLDADGVHIGQEDADAREVRRRLPDKIVGISAHNREEAEAAVRIGADYLGVGPMYATNTKSDIREVRGPIVISEMRHGGISLPLVGIGGINEQNAAAVMQAGADGIAVITAISKAASARQAAVRLRQTVAASRGGKQ